MAHLQSSGTHIHLPHPHLPHPHLGQGSQLSIGSWIDELCSNKVRG